MPSVSTSIDIAAPPEAIWAVLTDYDRYPEWNPFVVSIAGENKVDRKLAVTIKPPNGSSGMSFAPTLLTYIPSQHLHWRGRLLNIPYLFTGHHHFLLRPSSTPNTTTLEQWEDFSGILALVLHWIGSDAFEVTKRGFAMMNEALKERVERREREGEGAGGLRQRV